MGIRLVDDSDQEEFSQSVVENTLCLSYLSNVASLNK